VVHFDETASRGSHSLTVGAVVVLVQHGCKRTELVVDIQFWRGGWRIVLNVDDARLTDDGRVEFGDVALL